MHRELKNLAPSHQSLGSGFEQGKPALSPRLVCNPMSDQHVCILTSMPACLLAELPEVLSPINHCDDKS